MLFMTMAAGATAEEAIMAAAAITEVEAIIMEAAATITISYAKVNRAVRHSSGARYDAWLRSRFRGHAGRASLLSVLRAVSPSGAQAASRTVSGALHVVHDHPDDRRNDRAGDAAADHLTG